MQEQLKAKESEGKKTESLETRIERAKLDLELTKLTREYNLGTSLKSYIDPTAYVKWAKKVKFDIEKFYPTTLRNKFSWALQSKSKAKHHATRVHNCMSIKETKDGAILTIFVKPNSPKFKIELDGDEIVVYATEEPEKGKVNKEILKELTKLFHAKVELVSGATSKAETTVGLRR